MDSISFLTHLKEPLLRSLICDKVNMAELADRMSNGVIDRSGDLSAFDMSDADIIESSHQGSGKRLTPITMDDDKVGAIESDIVRKARNGLSQDLVHRRRVGVVHVRIDILESALLDFSNGVSIEGIEMHPGGKDV